MHLEIYGVITCTMCFDKRAQEGLCRRFHRNDPTQSRLGAPLDDAGIIRPKSHHTLSHDHVHDLWCVFFEWSRKSMPRGRTGAPWGEPQATSEIVHDFRFCVDGRRREHRGQTRPRQVQLRCQEIQAADQGSDAPISWHRSTIPSLTLPHIPPEGWTLWSLLPTLLYTCSVSMKEQHASSCPDFNRSYPRQLTAQNCPDAAST